MKMNTKNISVSHTHAADPPEHENEGLISLSPVFTQRISVEVSSFETNLHVPATPSYPQLHESFASLTVSRTGESEEDIYTLLHQTIVLLESPILPPHIISTQQQH